MNVLVTAGNTLVPIDRVRCLTNVFTGRTGASVALEAHRRDHSVTLLTSHPEAVRDLHIGRALDESRWRCERYRTFDDLEALMARHITAGALDVVIHSAAVSDYQAAGIFAPAPGTRFEPTNQTWHAEHTPTLRDRAAGKVKSDEPELWLRLVRAPKLIDRVRRPWGFRGILVKFKLEVDVTEPQLLEIAERSRRHSEADWIVANTLDGAATWAYLGSAAGYERVGRRDLPERLLSAVEIEHREKADG
jgi:phosphopantothenate---cysteine ligase (CTP)